MPARSLLRAFMALWLVTAVVLLIASLLTLRDGLGADGRLNPHLVGLGAFEAVAAVLFMTPRTLRAGAIGLLIAIAAAFVTHAILGQFRDDLLIYGTAVSFVLVHGRLTPAQLRAATSRLAA